MQGLRHQPGNESRGIIEAQEKRAVDTNSSRRWDEMRLKSIEQMGSNIAAAAFGRLERDRKKGLLHRVTTRNRGGNAECASPRYTSYHVCMHVSVSRVVRLLRVGVGVHLKK